MCVCVWRRCAPCWSTSCVLLARTNWTWWRHCTGQTPANSGSLRPPHDCGCSNRRSVCQHTTLTWPITALTCLHTTLHSPDQSLYSPVCTPHYTHLTNHYTHLSAHYTHLTNHSLLDRRTPHVQHTMAKRAMQSVARVKQEAQLMLTNPRDAFRGQLRSPNTVPFHMLGILSSCAIVTLSFLSLSFVFLLTFFWYSNSQNVVTLRSGSEVTQGHWKWYNILHMVSY